MYFFLQYCVFFFATLCIFFLQKTAVAEATYKIIKTEFAFNRVFKNLEELNKELRNYVLWYNYKRIHSTLEYMTPVEYRLANMTE